MRRLVPIAVWIMSSRAATTSEEWYGSGDLDNYEESEITDAKEWTSSDSDAPSSAIDTSGEDALSSEEAKGDIINPEDVVPNLDDFGTSTSTNVTGKLIYTCGGTGSDLSYCQFPFSTLAGNTYTDKCADQVEDNPDISTDRPWCFVSATEWGFCDCEANLDFTYITAPVHGDTSSREFEIQVRMDFPATVWCNLQAETDENLRSLESIAGKPGAGGVAAITDAMIWRSMGARIVFNAKVDFMKIHKKIVCQAKSEGLVKQPSFVSMLLGTNTKRPDGSSEDGSDDSDDDKAGPVLLTRTNGATVYSVLVFMLITSAIGVGLALEARKKLMFMLVNNMEEDNGNLDTHRPFRVTTK